jgi:hypothetical protein
MARPRVPQADSRFVCASAARAPPTRVAMYFLTPSAAAFDRSLFTGLCPPHSPTQSALSSSLCSLHLLLLLSPTPSSCTLSSHRFESSSLPPPFHPHCNSLVVASSLIHLPLLAMSSRSSTHPCIHSACGAVRLFSPHSPSPSLACPHSLSPSGSQSTSHTTIYFPAFCRPTRNPRIRVSTYHSVTASEPVPSLQSRNMVPQSGTRDRGLYT